MFEPKNRLSFSKKKKSLKVIFWKFLFYNLLEVISTQFDSYKQFRKLLHFVCENFYLKIE
jgi:hypothetical protein